ncbi:SDR family oxidoreductase [Profundibacterium mesophilum]|uniref:3-oxoacyl-acyl-carrier protein reductase n=1 Tax=Profundibacterium mesophilum KAUST100406-0324 TaxID=1037889 RepID=A0A921TDW6_9RHOB|nr:SDR family oxidoreductase [Profundibacterium mesophilum]KAF0676662.1 3-oxoacyl-acyl-carrier protein reductase [Profundibacterium mesophilum KAUST100406-0324]
MVDGVGMARDAHVDRTARAASSHVMEHDKKLALVTGAAGVIGRGIVAHLLANGWRVAALDRDAAALAELPSDPHMHTVTADIRDEGAVEQAVAQAAGDGALHLLVNNAGISDPQSGPLDTLPAAQWQRWIDTNLTGAMLMSRACTGALRRAGGAIVNVTSTRAAMSEPDCEAYAAAKGGLVALTHAMAISLGPDVRVNAVAPGWIAARDSDLRGVDHEQHPVGRVGRAEDVAEAVLYLAQAGFVTGQELTVDGGMTRKMIYAH